MDCPKLKRSAYRQMRRSTGVQQPFQALDMISISGQMNGRLAEVARSNVDQRTQSAGLR